MTPKQPAQLIEVDVAALRQARADRARERDPLEIVDFSGKLAQLKEFSILSSFARRKEREN
ncbi:MAG: hypothetical protein EXR11_02970 [Rhodospirillaceae bacterium]|nr:hypothetical protein [Rhodospirillaceae bacterium]